MATSVLSIYGALLPVAKEGDVLTFYESNCMILLIIIIKHY